MMTLQQAAQWVAHERLIGDATMQFERVHTDTRTLRPGDLFVALRGENFDANRFLAQARTAGARGAIAEHGIAEAGLAGLEVKDSRLALGQLAQGWRRQFRLPLIAVTGSNGKTTVTQMLAAVLQAFRGDQALATQGNLNNEVGAPLTLLRLRAEHRIAVLELGMNHPGEIDYLARLAGPTVALVNNAQREHLEFMASVEAVARENGSVISQLPPDGIAVFPAADTFAPLWRQLAGARRVIEFALSTEPVRADVTALEWRWESAAWQVRVATPVGPLGYRLRIAGEHNVRNSLAAVACALAAGVAPAAIEQGLSAFEPVKGRSRALQVHIAGHALNLVDDSYNANPDSVRAAIDVLASLPGPSLLVLGDMAEVGDGGPAFHAEVGRYARERGIGQLFSLGELARHSSEAYGKGEHFADLAALLDALSRRLPGVGSVLVKGSRFMRMERVVDAILATSEPSTEATC